MKSFKPKQFKPQIKNPGQNMPISVQTMQTKDQRSQSNVLRLIPLGGVGNVTKNMFVYEYGDDIVIVDCGVSFPDEDMPGVDLVIPDISYLRDKKHKIRGIIITHAHDDHIGGLPYIWPELNVPIYSQKLTCGFIKGKFTEHNLPKDQIKTLDINATLKLGSFNISFYQVSHSVPDSTGIILSTPIGTLIHQADFKIDWTPLNGQVTDVAKVAITGNIGVNLLAIDCLGVEKKGYTPSELNIEPTFEKIESETKGKLLITLVASNITRIQQAINVAIRAGRKITFVGRSLENNSQVARDLGYLNIPPNLIIAQQEVKRFADNKLLIIIAGAFGQVGSALSRAANNDHKFISIGKDDTVVFSADPMPSAVVAQGVLIDNLSRTGCNIFASTLTPDLHVSGHAAVEEIKVMINLIKPKFILPMGGEYKHMKAFSKMAQTLGYKESQILIPDEGGVIEIDRNKAVINGKVETSNVYVDGLGVGDIGSIVLRDRQLMSQEGMVVAIVRIESKNGYLVGEPDLISRGFVFGSDAEEFMQGGKQIVKSVLSEHKGGALDWRYMRHEIEVNLEKFFYKETQRSPLILPIIIEV